jgi:hypothetical protein
LLTAFIGLAGLYLGNSYRRNLRVQLAERRLKAFSELWELTEAASPSLERIGQSISEDVRTGLYLQMAKWYYKKGNGLLVGGDTRDIFLAAKENLVGGDDELKPPELRPNSTLVEQERSTYRAKLAKRQLSLLRASMRSDLAVYGGLYYPDLSPKDRAFLRYCDVNLWRKPWRKPWRKKWRAVLGRSSGYGPKGRGERDHT